MNENVLTSKKKLQVIIEYYEQEKKECLSLINESLRDENFLAAHNFQSVLRLIQKKIDILGQIKDTNYLKKKRLIELVTNISSLLKNPTNEWDGQSNSLELALKKAERELEELNNIPFSEITDISGSALDTAIIDLIAKRIRSFNLYKHQSKNLCLQFRFVSRRLKVKVSNLPWIKETEEATKKYYLGGWQKLGFKSEKKGSYLLLDIEGKPTEILDSFYLLLSRIVFEIFESSDGHNNWFLEIPG